MCKVLIKAGKFETAKGNNKYLSATRNRSRIKGNECALLSGGSIYKIVLYSEFRVAPPIIMCDL